MKKYDRVDLTADNFKAKKTPQKIVTNANRTSLKSSPAYCSKQSAQKLDPNNLFQKVCCPNCRYIFKIIKNTQILFPQPSPKKITTAHASIQTDQMQLKELKMLSKMSYQLSKMEHSESSIFKTGLIKHNNVSKSQIIKEPEHLKESTYKFPGRASVTNIKPRRISNATADHNKSQSFFYEPSRNGFGNKDNSATNKKEAVVPQPQNIQHLMYEQYQKAWREVRQQVRRDLYALPSLLQSQLNNGKTIDELVSFYADLPPEIEIPSYCKMLIRDYQIQRLKPPKQFKVEKL